MSKVFVATGFFLLMTYCTAGYAVSTPPTNGGLEIIDYSFDLSKAISRSLVPGSWDIRLAEDYKDNLKVIRSQPMSSRSLKRALEGMFVISGALKDPTLRRVFFYNIAYDVGLLMSWQVQGQNQFVLKELYLVPGELMRGETPSTIPPGWVNSDPLAGIVETFKKVDETTRHTLPILAEAAADNVYFVQNRNFRNAELVLQRAIYGDAPLDLELIKPQITEATPTVRKSIENAVYAASLANDVVACTNGKVGQSGRQVFDCIQAKDKFNEYALPTKTGSLAELGHFLDTTFAEESLALGETSIAFVASHSLNNNYRFIITTKDGRPDGLTLIDFAMQ